MRALVIAHLIAICAHAAAVNDRPIIGVLTLPSIEGLPTNASYLPASYVHWLEAAGLRVAPVRYDLPEDDLIELSHSVNGILFTGGSSDLVVKGKPTQYFNAARVLFEEVKRAPGRNASIALWGTCLGLEALSMLLSDDNGILSPFDAENISLPLDFTQFAPRSKLFGSMPPSVAAAFRKPITVNEHSLGVTPRAVRQSSMSPAVNILSTNVDLKGETFVSSFEHRTLPIFAVQFHPERPAFEWITQRYIPHSSEAVQGMQYLANTFAAAARNSFQAFHSIEHGKRALIYNWAPFYSEDATAYYEQTYVFPLVAT